MPLRPSPWTPRVAAAPALLVLLAIAPARLSAQRTIEPYRAREIQVERPRPADAPSGDAKPKSEKAAEPRGASALAEFVGSWQLSVEGAVRTDDDVAARTRTTTVTAGAAGRRLELRADGSYLWGQRRGRWRATGEPVRTGWPILLEKADQGKDWKVGWDTRRQGRAGDILVWDGYIWEVGRRLR